MGRKSRFLCMLLLVSLFLTTFAFAKPGGNKGKSISSTGTKVDIAGLTAQDFIKEKKKCETRTADFGRLRYAYTKTADYKPYSMNSSEEDAMKDAFNKTDYRKTISIANRILKKNYVSIDAHLMCAISYIKLGDKKKESFHTYMVEGLLKSIMDSGDGRSPEKPMVVICVHEEYMLLESLGLDSNGHTHIIVNGHHVDRQNVIDPKTGKTTRLYFNIDIPHNHLVNTMFKNLPKDKK